MPSFYKQGQSPWGSYPYAGETMAAAGCGPTSVANILDKSPWEVAQWMTSNGYASNGYGTYHEGIYAAVRAYGYECNKISTSSLAGSTKGSTFDTFQKSIQEGNCGILLMGGQSTGCISNYWSKAGHYIAIIGYSNGQYRVSDGAYAARDGYHPWSDFVGNIKHIYTTNVKCSTSGTSTNTSTEYKFTVDQISFGSTGIYVKLWQVLLKGRGLYAGEIDGKFGNGTKSSTLAFQKTLRLNQDGIVGPSTWSAMIPVSSFISGVKRTFTCQEISPGFQGNEAYFWQNLMKGYGYYTGVLDLSYGEGCRAATIKFQKAHGMAGDGIVGKNSLKWAVGL